MAKQTYTTGQVLTTAQMTTLQTNDFNQTVSAKTASYTLVAADAGTRITMSNAGATTVTVNTGLFAAGDTLQITNIGAGVCTVTAGTATVSTAGVLTLAQNASGTLYFTSTGVSILDGSAAAGGGGKVLQVVQATTTTIVVNNTTTYADTTLTGTITPSLASSKVLVLVAHPASAKSGANAGNAIGFKLFRGATEIAHFSEYGNFTNTAITNIGSFAFNYLDSPSTTSATTYKTQFNNLFAGAEAGVQHNNRISSIILMEIGA